MGGNESRKNKVIKPFANRIRTRFLVIDLSLSLSVCLSVGLSLCLSVCLSVSLSDSFCLSVGLSLSPSITIYFPLKPSRTLSLTHINPFSLLYFHIFSPDSLWPFFLFGSGFFFTFSHLFIFHTLTHFLSSVSFSLSFDRCSCLLQFLIISICFFFLSLSLFLSFFLSFFSRPALCFCRERTLFAKAGIKRETTQQPFFLQASHRLWFHRCFGGSACIPRSGTKIFWLLKWLQIPPLTN